MKRARPDTKLSPSTAEQVLRRADVRVDGPMGCRPVPAGNRVFELSTGSGVFFLKLPTKDFVDSVDPAVLAGVRVTQEWAAWECLRRHDVPAVDVVAVEAEADNPMGWPYLLTRGLTGRPLLEFVQRPSYLDWQAALLATGDYLAASHSITFDASGYIVSPDGPAPDRAGRPLHTVHDPAEEQAAALSDLVLARHFLDADLADDLAGRFHVIGETIAPEYDPPRFVHAAFHPNHPHVERSGGVLRVSGCVDMESASAGAVFDDLTTLAIGMMVGARGVAWWEPLFEGYGKAPDLERFRMALLATCFYCFGEEHALQDVQSTYRALLAAETWAELFGANRSAASA